MTPPRRPSRWRDLSRTLGVVVQTLTVLVLLALVAWPERHLELSLGVGLSQFSRALPGFVTIERSYGVPTRVCLHADVPPSKRSGP